MHYTKKQVKVENDVVVMRDVYDDIQFKNLSGKFVYCLFCSRRLTRSYYVSHCRHFHSDEFEDANVNCNICHLKVHSLNLNHHRAGTHGIPIVDSEEAINEAESEKVLSVAGNDLSSRSGCKRFMKRKSQKVSRLSRNVECTFCFKRVARSYYARHRKLYHRDEGQKAFRSRFPRLVSFDAGNEVEECREVTRVDRTVMKKPHDLTFLVYTGASSANEKKISKKKKEKATVNDEDVMKIIGSTASVANVNRSAAVC